MEIALLILIYVGFGYALYKVAKSKNREPLGWILIGLILSPIIVLIILALMPTVKSKRTGSKEKINREKSINLYHIFFPKSFSFSR